MICVNLALNISLDSLAFHLSTAQQCLKKLQKAHLQPKSFIKSNQNIINQIPSATDLQVQVAVGSIINCRIVHREDL